MASDNYRDSEEYFDGADDDGTFSGLGVGSFEKPAFEEAQYKYAKSMSDSPYLKEIESFIKAQPLTSRYKRSLLSCIYTLFTEEQVLANNNSRIRSKFVPSDPLFKKLVFAQRDIELTRCDYTKYDLRAVNTYALEKYILSVFEAFITRTIGDKREGIINREIGIRNISQFEKTMIKPQEEPQKNKGILAKFRRNN